MNGGFDTEVQIFKCVVTLIANAVTTYTPCALGLQIQGIYIGFQHKLDNKLVMVMHDTLNIPFFQLLRHYY